MVEKYKLDELLPITDNSILYVVGKNYHFYVCLPDYGTTWRDVLDKAIMNRKAARWSCLIIIENALNGKVYQFGNYDRKYVYEHGKTNGYA